jgi:hypothetical protein
MNELSDFEVYELVEELEKRGYRVVIESQNDSLRRSSCGVE